MKRCPHCGFSLEPERALFDDIKRVVVSGQPATSWEAAAKMLRSRSKTQKQVGLTFLACGPLTDLDLHERCCERYGTRAESSYRKRRTDLTELLLVENTGRTKVEQGERRVIWDLSAAGRAVFKLAKE
jgi:hypothetical protein